MSKSLPSLLFSAACIVLGTQACEPATATVVEVDTIDTEDDGPGRPQDAARDARGPARLSDAGVGADVDLDAGVFRFPELDDPEGCLLMTDQTTPNVLAGDAAVLHLVEARSAVDEGCWAPDASAAELLLRTSVFSRRDGELMMQEGERYSYRWPATTVMGHVRLQGGEDACDNTTLVEREHGGRFVQPLVFATCYEFTAPRDARYMRTLGGDYWAVNQALFGAVPHELRLCKAACPPNTAFDFGDGGVDAGTPVISTPKLP